MRIDGADSIGMCGASGRRTAVDCERGHAGELGRSAMAKLLQQQCLLRRVNPAPAVVPATPPITRPALPTNPQTFSAHYAAGDASAGGPRHSQLPRQRLV